MKNKIRISLLFLLLFSAAACTASAPKNEEKEAIDPPTTLYPLQVGEQTIQVKAAVSTEEQRKGLMHIRKLPENEGMIFPYDTPRQLSFWMKNTHIPLDIAFIDPKGVIKEIHPMYPRNENSVQSYSDKVQYALEVNQGWFKANKIFPGASIDMTMLNSALKSRGFKASAK